MFARDHQPPAQQTETASNDSTTGHSDAHAKSGDAAALRMSGGPTPGADPYPVGTELFVHRPLGYSHSGVYVGNGEVVQVAGEPVNLVKALLHGHDTFETVINKVPLAVFAKGDAVTIGPSGTAANPGQAVQRALSQVGKPWLYDALKHNCQHFSSWCITGSETSPQANAILAVVQRLAKEEQAATNTVKKDVQNAETGVKNFLHHLV